MPIRTAGALLSSGQAFDLGLGVLERPDLLPRPAPRIINMIQLGRALTDPALAPPVRALYVYNSNPAAVCPHQSLVMQGLAREDLFTVVHEQVMTDTARYADLVLPATTSMEHLDLYRSYGHLYVQLAEPVLAAPRRGALELGGVPRAVRAPSAWPRSTTRRARSSSSARPWPRAAPPRATITLERLRQEGCVRLNVPRPYLPVRRRRSDPVREGGVLFGALMAQAGLPPLPTYVPLPGGAADSRSWSGRFPLQCIVPPNRFFLNSSFSQSELLRRRQRAPAVLVAPADAGPAASATATRSGWSAARGGALPGARHRRHAARRGRGRGALVAPLPARRAERQRAHERSGDRHGRRPGAALEPR